MKRLTNKNIFDYESYLSDLQQHYPLLTTKEIDDGIYHKLKKLENLEQELGIDLITLFKVLKQNYIYVKHDCFYNTFVINKEYILGLKYADDNTPVFWTDDYGKEHMVYIKDYGKTWALTREELEDEKED